MKVRKLLFLLIIGFAVGSLVMLLLMSMFHKEKSDTAISHTVVVQSIENIGNLEVVRYNVQDLIEYKKIRNWLPNAKTALIVSGEIIVCIDFTKITSSDIQTRGDSVYLTLPEPEICHVKIDHSKSRVYNLEFGLWESEQIMDEAYRYAEQQLYIESQKFEIRDNARNNAANLLSPILQAMGFKYVAITLKPKTKEFGRIPH